MNEILFSNELSTYRKQLEYTEAFTKKYGDQIDGQNFFCIDDNTFYDSYTGENLEGISLGKSTWKQITNKLKEYYHIED